MARSNETEESPPPRRRFTDASRSFESVLGSQVAIRGEVQGTTNMDFAGSLHGDLELEGFFWLREIGTIEGDLSAGAVVIEGTVRGNIRALDKAEIRATGRVEGDITARSVAIADGAFFEGRITMAGASQSRTDVSFQEKRSSKK